ncbi:MAG: ATP-binding protein [Clostridia bacterium]|nr:ATP-binding protein [Clostridia bacterium]
MKTAKPKRRKSLYGRVARINSLTLFLSSTGIMLCVLALICAIIVGSEQKALRGMMEQLTERVVHIGTPSRIAFANITLRDGLEFAIYDANGQPLYQSSYSMPSTEVKAYPPTLRLIEHQDWTTFGEQKRAYDLICHAATYIQTDEETVLLHVVGSLSYLVTLVQGTIPALIAALPVMLLISILLGRSISRQTIVPIREISTQLSSKSSANLFERIDSAAVDCEFIEMVDAFNALMTQVEASFIRQREFISNASHELRTPLAVMDGHISMLLRWGKDDREQLESSLRILKKEVRSMTDMMTELLLISRADRGILERESVGFSVSELLEEIRQDVLVVSPQAILCIDAGRTLSVTGDRALIKQVFRILVDNSLRYCPPPGVITLAAREEGKGLRFSVVDTGQGIAPSDLPHIFERFYRAHDLPDAQKGNSGLGLAIAKVLVEAMNGRITAQSQPHTRTEIAFFIPFGEHELSKKQIDEKELDPKKFGEDEKTVT